MEQKRTRKYDDDTKYDDVMCAKVQCNRFFGKMPAIAFVASNVELHLAGTFRNSAGSNGNHFMHEHDCSNIIRQSALDVFYRKTENTIVFEQEFD